MDRCEPERAEAWFYLGAAYGARVQWQVLRRERLAAARDGKRIKDALEKALALDPTLYDARFGIGLYRDYADIAPAAAKILRFFLLLPGGDRTEGLNDMLLARERGALLRGEADYQLHWIYFWYEEQPQRGLAVLRDLHAAVSTQPALPERIAEVEDEYFHDVSASLAAWQDLLADGPGGAVHAAPLARARAQLGAAARLDDLYETDRAIEHLRGGDRRPAGRAVRGRGAGAAPARRLRGSPGPCAPRDRRVSGRDCRGPPRDPAGHRRRGARRDCGAGRIRTGEAYRLSLAGWRASSAARSARPSRSSTRRSPCGRTIRSRSSAGRACTARARKTDRALTLFGALVRGRPVAPPVSLRARVRRARGAARASHDRAGAIELYANASARLRRRCAHAAARRAGGNTPAAQTSPVPRHADLCAPQR